MEYLAVLVPSVGIGIIFYFIMRWAFRADRTERRHRAESEEDARQWYEQIKAREDSDELFRDVQRYESRKRRG